MVETNELKSWTQFADPGIRYYSGTARYVKVFTLSLKDIKDRMLLFDLGNVQEMANCPKISG